jgi:hypothetical protein
MSDNTRSIEVSDTEIFYPDDLVRQDYGITQLAGQKFVIPNAFKGVNLPLAMVQKPDYSMAVDKPRGVRVILFTCFQSLKCLISIFQFRLEFHLGHMIFLAWSHEKVV